MNPIDDAQFDEIMKANNVTPNTGGADPWARYTQLQTPTAPDFGFLERSKNEVKAAVADPVEGAKGAVKGLVQGAVGISKAVDMGVTGAGAAMVGDEEYNLGDTSLDYTAVNEMTQYSNDAQKGGALIENVAEIATGVKPLVQAAIKKGPGLIKEGVEAVATRSARKQEKGILDTIVGKDEEMSKAMREDAIMQGRKTETKGLFGTQKVEYSPAEELKNAAKVLQKEGKVRSGDVPTVVKKKVEEVIVKRGKEAEDYLDANVQMVDPAEHVDLFNNLKKTVGKRDDRPLAKTAYDGLIDNFTARLDGKDMNTANYYRALKEWEKEMAATIPRGQEALLDSTGFASGRVRAAADIRAAVRDMIGSKNPEFKPQMYDLMSLYRAKDQAVYNALKFKKKNWAQANPWKAGAIGGAASASGIGVGWNLMK